MVRVNGLAHLPIYGRVKVVTYSLYRCTAMSHAMQHMRLKAPTETERSTELVGTEERQLRVCDRPPRNGWRTAIRDRTRTDSSTGHVTSAVARDRLLRGTHFPFAFLPINLLHVSASPLSIIYHLSSVIYHLSSVIYHLSSSLTILLLHHRPCYRLPLQIFRWAKL